MDLFFGHHIKQFRGPGGETVHVNLHYFYHIVTIGDSLSLTSLLTRLLRLHSWNTTAT